ncbi:MAG: FAD-dependent oxidoreductase, partial [Chloroflexota bacterium]|nr:FAD-dependent oxidoreductase [Chloroflexota bacterium]
MKRGQCTQRWYHRSDVSHLPKGQLNVAVGSSNSFDLIILGGGTGGYSAAFRAGQLGLKVALIDQQPKLGGTCLHWG